MSQVLIRIIQSSRSFSYIWDLNSVTFKLTNQTTMRVILMRFWAVIATSLILWGCYPDGAEYYEDTDITFTQYDVDFNFKSRTTFALPDKIVIDVEIKNGDTTYIYMKDSFAFPILQAIRSNMENYGWRQVDISAKPNVVITPAAIQKHNSLL